MPGHGTATLALLAGNTVDLSFETHRFQGDIGGAPDAEVIPVRISPSVIHLYTSTMAKGLYHAMAPRGDYSNRCDVVSISHGGLPTPCWADAVNMLYEDGITIVAASGDSIFAEVIDIATHYTVYPSAFNRVLTAVGATYWKRPYTTKKLGVIQGCWGPDIVMEKAVAAFTPNVVWMVFDSKPCGFAMSGGGTSSSTPQIAAACALWLQLYGNKLPVNWQRIEACRLALFDSADNKHRDKSKLGWGTLNVKKMLDPKLAARLIKNANDSKLQQSAEDSVSDPFSTLLRLILGIGPPNSEAERMYETEVVQVVLGSRQSDLLASAWRAVTGARLKAAEPARLRTLFLAEKISDALRKRIEQSSVR